MKTVARMALKPGMVIGEDVLNYKNELIFPVDTVVDDLVIAKLARHSIMCVAVKEEIDYATTHFEKIRLSTEFKYFEVTYNDCMPIYRKIMTDFVTQNIPIRISRLMELYVKISSCARSGEQLLDFLYNMLPSEDDMTHAHCLNSALIAGVFGTWLGLPKEEIFLLIQCGFFYDIGKLKLPNSLIWKPSKLTDLEFTQMKTHTILGFELLKDMNVNEHVLKATLQHHERCDGTGYPSRLRGDRIDVFAKYIAIIDSYEAMTSARTYRQSLNPFQVIANFEKSGFDKYDETIIKPILSHIASTQLGLSVRLNNDTEAEIILINQEHLSRPLLKTVKDEMIDLSKAPELEIVSIY
ncbi:MAG: HD domain-containing protein [Lachnospiraceae bacterium]|nr:HD domain-containing protein [Lachnospiraceae bacterium]